MNEMVFPAGIMQPPFFKTDAPEAANYGGGGELRRSRHGDGPRADPRLRRPGATIRRQWQPERVVVDQCERRVQGARRVRREAIRRLYRGRRREAERALDARREHRGHRRCEAGARGPAAEARWRARRKGRAGLLRRVRAGLVHEPAPRGGAAASADQSSLDCPVARERSRLRQPGLRGGLLLPGRSGDGSAESLHGLVGSFLAPAVRERVGTKPVRSEWELADSQFEARLRTWAVPAALASAFLVVSTGAGHFLVRVFLSMWVHELGHATTAWLCGFPAFPGPWLTPMAQSRSPFFSFVVFAAIAGSASWAWRTGRRRLCAVLGGLLAVQLFCTLALSVARAKQLIIFMGDGGCLVLGSLLMLTVYAPEESALKRGCCAGAFSASGQARSWTSSSSGGRR